MNTAVELPSPRDWQVFEDFCRDLFAAEWGYPETQKHGRPGQQQHGVDVIGRRDGRWLAVQCKLRQTFPEKRLTERALIDEVTAARHFEDEQLEMLVVATTAPPDTKIQKLARRLTDEHASEGQFSVLVYGWSDLCERLQKHPVVFEQWRSALLGRRPTTHSGVSAVPQLPPHYQPRAEDLADLKRKILGLDGSHQGITGTGKAGVQGMGGIGKTVLAAALARDPEIREAFPDGVFWVTVGQEPRIEALQRELAVAAGDQDAFVSSIAQGELVLERCLADRRLLVILDDVWLPAHASAFDVVRSPGKILITTRNAEVLVQLGAEELQLDLLSETASLELLADWAGCEVEALPTLASEVVQACGRLPLALAMIGAMVRRRPTVWADALARLQRVELGKLKRSFPKYPYPDLLRALAASVEALEPTDRERYLELAVFPEDAAIPEAAIETLWAFEGLDGLDARELVDRLVDRSLMTRDAEGRLRLHDLQGDYLRAQIDDLPALHQRLVNAYVECCVDGFPSGPDDGYFFERLPEHLTEAGRIDELRDLLLDFSWIRSKLAHTNVNALMQDYRAFETDRDLRLVRAALRLSAHVLVSDPDQLAVQLPARLLVQDRPVLRELLLQIENARQDSPYLVPRVASLDQAGGALVRVLEGHANGVHSVAVTSDKRVVSAADDNTLRVWDIESGETLKTLEGHANWVRSVAVIDDKRVVSAAYDNTLRVWDIESGDTLKTLEGHANWVQSVAVIDDKYVVSASFDKTLRVWDIDSGSLVTSLNLDAAVWSVAALRDIVVAGDQRGRMHFLELHGPPFRRPPAADGILR